MQPAGMFTGRGVELAAAVEIMNVSPVISSTFVQSMDFTVRKVLADWVLNYTSVLLYCSYSMADWWTCLL